MKFILALLALLAGLFAASAYADEDTIDMTHAVFVSLADQHVVPYIDPDVDKIAGSIDVGLVPKQIEIASSIGKLLAIDGKSPQVNIVDLQLGTIRTVSLDLVPSRMTVSSDGLTVALADTEGGHVVLLDLLRRQIVGSAGNLPPLRDMVFSTDSKKLYLAGAHAGAIDVIDAAKGQLVPAIATGLPHGSLAFGRSPNGQRLFVQSDSGGGVGVLDLERSGPLAPIPAGPAATVAFPSATGAYLLVVDNQRGTLMIIRDGDAQNAAVLKAATGVSIVYTAWFDSLALVPSSTAKTLFLYDLEAMHSSGEIALAGTPARGGVTPDGQKLYLPLTDADQVAVINAQRRKLAASIAMPGHPTAIVLAGSYGVCH
jgi:DNA-binding beta-propeller fold protein YncE